MNVIKFTLLAMTGAAAFLTGASPASAAALLEGKTVSAVYRYPTQGDVYESYGTKVINGSTVITTTLGGQNNATLTVSDHNVRVVYHQSLVWNNRPFNGFSIGDALNQIAAFTSFTINPQTNVTNGFNASRLSFDADNLFVNWSGLLFNDGDVLSLDINGGSAPAAVPEPATWGMMVLGFGMVGFGLRRRSKQSVRVTYA